MKTVGIFVLLLVGVMDARAASPDRAELLDGVKEIGVTGLPGPLCVFGESAFVVLAGQTDKLPSPLAAASSLGNGRLVAFGHNGYLGAEVQDVADTARFIANAARWSAKKSPRPGAKIIGLRGCKSLESTLTKNGLKVAIIDGGPLVNHLREIDSLLLPAGEIHDADLPALEDFIRKGGGIVSGAPGWGFLQTHPGASLAKDLPANRLFAKAGIVWADGTVDAVNKRFAAQPDVPVLLNASAALSALTEEAAGRRKLTPDESKLTAAQLTRAAQSIPSEDPLLLPALEKAAAASKGQAVVSDKTDLLAGNGLAKVALTIELARQRALPADRVCPNPLAERFPGAVPSAAPRVKRQIEVDLSIPDWHSAGLYAAPGEVVTVTVPSDAAGLKLRIGSHSDKLWHLAQWRRAPEIDRVWSLAPGDNKVANSFGGLIYIVVPHGGSGIVKVSIEHAVESPLFVLGKTDPSEWRTRIRNSPGPWGEVASEKIILTVPSQFLRTVDDPAGLMEWWNKVSDGAADLYAIPRHRPRAERYVSDIQISAGYMHSGYPIMTWLDAAPRMVDLPTLRTKGEWGLFHELGHNHQKPEWTFSGTVEVTNNLLPLYLLETLCNKASVHGSFTPPVRVKNEAKYIANGADFAKWQADPFLALIMYQQLRDAFGWETYQKVFAEYRDLPAVERPKTDLEKHDQWMVRFSKAAGHNLGPFFQHWGVPTSEAARHSIAELPAWMPS